MFYCGLKNVTRGCLNTKNCYSNNKKSNMFGRMVFFKDVRKTLLKFKAFGSVWYMCLKIENCYLKIFVKIRVGEKVYKNV